MESVGTSALMNINGTVGRGSVGTDMNVIPVAAIERIEILRDGASAQYGSDAIAGVINIVLKKNFSGLTASLTTGINDTNLKWNTPILGGTSQKANNLKINDGSVLQFDLSKGFRLGKEGALTISGQYNEHGNTNRSGYDNAPTIYLGASGGFPTTPTGAIQNDFRTKLVADDASIVSARNYNRRNMVFGNSTSRNIGVFANGFIPTSEKAQIYFGGGVTYRTGKGFGNNRIPVSRAQQPLNSDGSLSYPDGFLPAIASVIGDQSLILGYKTKLGSWNMDLSNTFGKNSFNFNVENSGNASLPNGNNQQAIFDAGTLKFDQNTTNLDFSKMFEKLGGIQALNIAFGTEYRRDHYQIVPGEINSYIGADLKKLVGGAPLVIGGPTVGTTLALPGSQVFPGFQPSDAINKARTNLGVYADVEGELFNRLFVDVAGRFEDYSDFGSNFSGKVATRLRIVDAIALRGSVSTGFRAPSLHQRYFQNTSTQFVSGLPSNTLTVNNDNPIARTSIGVDALRPETSKSVTIGITAKVGKVSLTVDAYQIDIKDRIVYSGAFSRALLGFTADQYVGINNVNFFANAANTSTKGVDIVLNSKFKMGSNALSLMASANFNQNKVTAINSTKLIDSPTKNDPTGNPNTWFKNLLFDRQQISRIEVWQPLNKLNLSATYSIGRLDVTARAMRFGQVKYVHNVYTNDKKADGTYWNTAFNRNEKGEALIDQTFAPVVIADLIFGYRFGKSYNLSVGANNILDTYPQQNYIDPRNATGSIDYVSGRDASNRGRLLFQPNQGGYNGRHVFARLVANF
jgi:iron complex outermembrane recepter protein